MENQYVIERLQQQNKKLRNELKSLSRQLDEALDQKKQNEKTKSRKPQAEPQDEATIAAKEQELKGLLKQISRYKRDINVMKKQLDSSNNETKYVELENEAKYLIGRIKELKTENGSLLKVQRDQVKAIQDNTAEYPQKMKSIGEELKSAKEHYRELLNKQKQDEKLLKQQHEKAVALEQKCRNLELANKQKAKNRPPVEEPVQPEVSQNDIEELKSKVKEAENKKVEEEKKLKARIKNLEKTM